MTRRLLPTIVVLIISTLFQSVLTQNMTCNDDDDGTSSCYCKESLVTGRYKIFCQDILSSQEMASALNSYIGMKIELLEMRNVSLSYFHKNTFKGLDIHSVDFEDINVESLFLEPDPSNSPLKDLSTSLSFFRASDVQIKHSVDWNMFSDNKLLKTIHLSSVSSEGYKNWNKLSLNSLSNFIIFDCQINELPSKALSQLINVEDVIINYSKLSKITRDVFPIPSLKLKVLELSENNLMSLPEDLFTQMPSLQIVTLDNNLLKTISETTFAPIMKQLRGIAVSGNSFTCDKFLFWILKWNSSTMKSDIKKITCIKPKAIQDRFLLSLNENDLNSTP